MTSEELKPCPCCGSEERDGIIRERDALRERVRIARLLIAAIAAEVTLPPTLARDAEWFVDGTAREESRG